MQVSRNETKPEVSISGSDVHTGKGSKAQAGGAPGEPRSQVRSSEKLVLEYSWMGEDVSHRDSEGRVFQAEGMSVQKSCSNGQLPERLGGHVAGEKVHEPC